MRVTHTHRSSGRCNSFMAAFFVKIHVAFWYMVRLVANLLVHVVYTDSLPQPVSCPGTGHVTRWAMGAARREVEAGPGRGSRARDEFLVWE